MAASTFIPSKYQQAIFETVQKRAAQALVISAVPGAGKTETIRRILLYLPPTARVLAVAFNVDAAAQLNQKIAELREEALQQGQAFPAVEALTIHKLGNARLRAHHMSGKPNDRKYVEIAREYLSRVYGDEEGATALAKLVSLIRLTLADPSNADEISRIIERFALDDLWSWDLSALQKGARYLLRRGEELAQSQRLIDFTDMIYLPVKLSLPGPQYDYVLVDEAQDLSPCQRALVMSAQKPNGVFIAVGDRQQAIYGFAGASLNSLDEIIEATKAIEMPLSICYRCAREIVRLAGAIFPGIEPWEHAPTGKYCVRPNEDVADLVEEGDAILCRTNAPLIEMCLRLLREGKRALVRGHDLGSSIISLLKKIIQRYQVIHISALDRALDIFEEEEIARLLRSSKKTADDLALQIDAFKDRIQTIRILLDAYQTVFYAPAQRDQFPMTRFIGSESAPELEGFEAALERFFQRQSNGDNPHSNAIILSTVHRAKGQEWPRVFIIDWDRMPHPKAVKPEEKQQEEHLRYVAVTRAKHELYLCHSPKFAGAPEDLLPRQALPAPSLCHDNIASEEVEENYLPSEETISPAPDQQQQPSEQIPEPAQPEEAISPAARSYERKRKKFQGTFSPEFLNFLEAMREEGYEKSQLIEQIVFASPLYLRWKSGQSVAVPEAVPEPEPEPAPVAGGQLSLFHQPGASIAPQKRVFFVCHAWKSVPNGKRKRCGYRWAYDYQLSRAGIYERTDTSGQVHTLTEDQLSACPECGKSYLRMHTLHAKHNSSRRCTNSCQHAMSSECECACGGANHGIRHVRGAVLFQGQRKKST